MKWNTLQLHKEATMLCDKGMTLIEAQNALLVPQISKTTATSKPQMEVGKTCKHYINYGQNNHNVNMCKVKKEEPTIAMTKAISLNQNV